MGNHNVPPSQNIDFPNSWCILMQKVQYLLYIKPYQCTYEETCFVYTLIHANMVGQHDFYILSPHHKISKLWKNVDFPHEKSQKHVPLLFIYHILRICKQKRHMQPPIEFIFGFLVICPPVTKVKIRPKHSFYWHTIVIP